MKVLFCAGEAIKAEDGMELDRYSDWRGMRAVRHMGLGKSTAGKHSSSMTSISEQSLKVFGAMLEEMQQDCSTVNIYSRYCSLLGRLHRS
jgi:hypothetical protein